MLLKYTNFKDNDQSATINLFKEIGNTDTTRQMDGARFAEELRFLTEFKKVENVTVKINSPGGNVIHGISIFETIRANNANTHVVGVAASIAAIISQAGKNRTANDFSRLMFHPVSAKGSDSESEGIKQFQSMLIELLTAQTGQSEAYIKNIMSTETFLNAKQAEKKGFIDEVIPTERKPKNIFSAPNNLMELYNSCTEYIENETKTIIIPKTVKMNTIKNILNLDSSVNEEIVNVKVKETVEALNTANETNKANETKIAELENKVKEFEATAKEATDKLAVEYVENAIKAGKFDETKKTELIESAKNNFEGFKLIAEGIKAKHADITNSLSGDGASDLIPTERKDWDLRTWEKNDAVGIEKIRNTAPELYAEMYEKQYNTKLELS